MVAGELRPKDQNANAANPTSHPDAYQYYVRGIGYLQEYQNVSSLESAIALFHSALDRDPSFAAALAGSGEAYWHLFQETKNERLIAKATDACHRAATLNDNLASVHTTLGLIAQGQSKYQEAAKEFQRAIALDNTSDAAYRGLATSYEALGKPADAENAYRRAVEMRKDYWGGYSALGAFYYKTARYADAAAQFRRVIELAPENVRGYSNLSAAYVQLGKPEQAEELLRKSLAIQPSYRAYANLATIYFFQSRYSEAAEMYQNALQLNDRDGRIWRNLGDAYYWAPNQRDKSAPAYQHAAGLLTAQLKINPQDPSLLTELALCQSMLGKTSEALDLIERAREHAASDPEISYRTAEIYEQDGDHAAALEWLSRAVKKGYPMREIQRDPTFEKVREDARYKQLLQATAAQPPH
jgi:serine/threonine-protein kinase